MYIYNLKNDINPIPMSHGTSLLIGKIQSIVSIQSAVFLLLFCFFFKTNNNLLESDCRMKFILVETTLSG